MKLNNISEIGKKISFNLKSITFLFSTKKNKILSKISKLENFVFNDKKLLILKKDYLKISEFIKKSFPSFEESKSSLNKSEENLKMHTKELSKDLQEQFKNLKKQKKQNFSKNYSLFLIVNNFNFLVKLLQNLTLSDSFQENKEMKNLIKNINDNKQFISYVEKIIKFFEKTSSPFKNHNEFKKFIKDEKDFEKLFLVVAINVQIVHIKNNQEKINFSKINKIFEQNQELKNMLKDNKNHEIKTQIQCFIKDNFEKVLNGKINVNSFLESLEKFNQKTIEQLFETKSQNKSELEQPCQRKNQFYLNKINKTSENLDKSITIARF